MAVKAVRGTTSIKHKNTRSLLLCQLRRDSQYRRVARADGKKANLTAVAPEVPFVR